MEINQCSIRSLCFVSVVSLLLASFFLGKYFDAREIKNYFDQHNLFDSQASLESDRETSNPCLYRTPTNIDLSGSTYEDVAKSTFRFRHTIINDYNFIKSRLDPYLQPTIGLKASAGLIEQDINTLRREGLLVQYLAQKPIFPTDKAILLIHGNSSSPDDVFTDTGSYLNNSGSKFVDEGFAVFAPYVTHDSRFQNARSRLISTLPDLDKNASISTLSHLDVERIVILLEEIASSYQSIQVVGISYGGDVVVDLYRRLQSSDGEQNLDSKISSYFVIEGGVPSKYWIRTDNPLANNALFDWNWEMVFYDDHRDLREFSADPKTMLFSSSCNRNIYYPIYSSQGIAERHVEYTGGHEIPTDIVVKYFKMQTEE